MAYNKVIYGGNTLIDLTADTITADKLASGYTAHDASGALISGTMEPGGNTGGYKELFEQGSFVQIIDDAASFVMSSFYSSARSSVLNNLSYIELQNCKEVRQYGFKGLLALASISFPECITVELSAFYGCSSLTNIYMPKLQNIGERAFAYCNLLTAIELPECTSIAQGAFLACRNLSYLSLPKLSLLGSGVFSRVGMSTSSPATFYLPNVTYISQYAFYGVSNLVSINLPALTSTADSIFCSCSLLTDVSVPNLQSVNYVMFGTCSALSVISFPKCVTIANYAFSNCGGLSSVYFLGSSVAIPEGKSVFYNSNSSEIDIYVPASLYGAYCSVWSSAGLSSRIKSVS